MHAPQSTARIILLNWLFKHPVQFASAAAILCWAFLQTPCISIPTPQTSAYFMSSVKPRNKKDNRHGDCDQTRKTFKNWSRSVGKKKNCCKFKMPSCIWNASEHHFVLVFKSVMSEKLRAPQWALDSRLQPVSQKRQDYVLGISHSGVVPKVRGSSWEGEKCSLHWHFHLDSASWINHRTTA